MKTVILIAILALFLATACAPTPDPVSQDLLGSDSNPNRAYNMVLWDDGGNNKAQDADMAFFSEGQAQPKGTSLINILNWNTSHFIPLAYDYNRVAAFIIDEPFLNNLTSITRKNNLKSTILALKALSPHTKIWVNFSQPELDYQMAGNANFILPQIDVISIDIYREYINPVYNDWLLSHRTRSNQKLSLIISTFYEAGVDDPAVIADMLYSYFNYADAHPGDIYTIVGYKRDATSSDPGVTYIGESNPAASDIRNVWLSQLNKPR